MSAQSDLKYVGRSIPISDGLEKITGRALYAGDVSLPGLLHARPILSPYAHARIVSVDTSDAKAVPGVVAVLTHADLPNRDRPGTNRNTLVLASDRVVFRGQPVAVVVATSEAAAQDAADAVMIDYDPLPAAVDPVQAMQPNAPLVWPNGVPKDDSGLADVHAGAQNNENQVATGNTAMTHNYTRGDVAAGFAQSDVIVERTYRTGIVHQAYLEPHAAVASFDPVARSLTVWTSTQGQFGVRSELAGLFRLPKGQVKVIPMKVGGGFGAKYGILEPLVSACSIKLGRPVKMVLSRSEDFLTTTPSPATVIELKTGAKRDGSLTALQARVIVDQGVFPFGLGGIICTLLGGYYKFPNLQIDGYEVLTNKPQVGAYRAPGAPQATFAIESNIDDMARELGLDPLQFRLQNAVETGDPMPDGKPWPHIGLKQCIQAVADHPLWLGRQSSNLQSPVSTKRRGVGLAVGGWPGGTAPAAAVCRIDSDGKVNVHLGSVDISGSNTSMVLLAAEVLGVKPEQVRIISGDTETGPYAGPSGGSMITYTVGAAVVQAAQETRTKLLQVAAEMFEADVADLELREGVVSVKGVPGKTKTVAEIAEKTMDFGTTLQPIVGDGGSGINKSSPGFTAQLIEVEVDTTTGEVEILRNVLAQDVGKAINPMLVEGQAHGGLSQGLGYGLWEELVYDEDGQLMTASFMDYTMPNSQILPNFEVHMVENPSPQGPFGARGIGEPSIVAGAAATANAIKAAAGARVAELPLRPERVFQALHGQMN